MFPDRKFAVNGIANYQVEQYTAKIDIDVVAFLESNTLEDLCNRSMCAGYLFTWISTLR
jgi:hypothetical protein